MAASLSQIGEFPFILAGPGLQLKLLLPESMRVVLAGAPLSIALNPLVVTTIAPLSRWALAHSALARRLEAREVPFVAADQNRELVEELRRQALAAASGDAAVLIQAHIAEAAMLVVATPDTLGVRPMVEAARRLNPGTEVLVRTHSEEESVLQRLARPAPA